MNARYFGLWIVHQVLKPKRARAPDHAVDLQRPAIPLEARNAEMAKHNEVLGARLTVSHLVGCKRIPLERALRVEPHGMTLPPHFSDSSFISGPLRTSSSVPWTENRPAGRLLQRLLPQFHNAVDVAVHIVYGAHNFTPARL